MPPQDDFHTPNHPAVPSPAVFVEWTQVVLSLTTQRHASLSSASLLERRDSPGARKH